jgi:hypothetical protein
MAKQHALPLPSTTKQKSIYRIHLYFGAIAQERKMMTPVI